MTRPAQARVDLGALRHNYSLARRLHGGRSLAVLKANAYGHGAVRCAQALQPLADGFAVAFLEEALTLRAHGIAGPILILEGVFEACELGDVVAASVWTVVHHDAQVQMIERCAHSRDLHVWLKVDSGMGRAGFAPEHVRAAHRRLMETGKVAAITLMTHFARADEPDSGATPRQIASFDKATAGLPGPRSLANSAGLLAWPAARREWARPGIVLYGADPIAAGKHGLRPVMTLKSQIFAVRTLQAGEPLGYGGTFVASRPTRIGLVATGYADGYPRSAPNGVPVAIDGQRSQLIGRVSMDMLTVDLSELPNAGLESEVELWGPTVGVNDVAGAAGTVSYELLCNVKRVPIHYDDTLANAQPGRAARQLT